MIHSTAIVHETAQISEGVVIGKNVQIGPYCIIGEPAENKKTWSLKPKGVIIGEGTIITGQCTIDAGAYEDTLIGKNCFLMKGSHVGHDAILEDNVTLSPHAIIGGHAVIMRGANLGMGATVHQFGVVGCDSMVGANSFVRRWVEINSKVVGCPAKHINPNSIPYGKNNADMTRLGYYLIKNKI